METQLATLEHGRHALAGAAAALSDSSSTDDAETVDDDDVDGFSRFWDDYFDLLEAAKRKLEEDYREDGPPVGFHFDDPPPEDKANETKTMGDKGTGGRGAKKKLALGEFEGNVGDDGEIVSVQPSRTHTLSHSLSVVLMSKSRRQTGALYHASC